MKKISLFLFLAAVLLTAALPASAQQQAGDSELQLQGSLSLGLKGDAPDNGTVFLNYGRFFTEKQELGLTVFAFVAGSSDLSGFGGPFYRYNFSSGKTVPYLGVSAATPFGDFGGSDILLTFEAGVKWYLERNLAFSLAANSNYDTDTSEFADQLQVLFGFSYVWGK